MKPRPLTRRLKWRFALWIGGHAGSLCAWANEIEQRNDPRPECPDCGSKECYCEERWRERELHAAIDGEAYYDGLRDGYERARMEEFS